MKRDNINIFESYVDTLYDSNYELVPMADFESYKVFGAIERRFPEYIKNTFIAVKPKLFNNVSFLSFVPFSFPPRRGFAGVCGRQGQGFFA